MALDSKQANRIFFMAMGTIVGINLLALVSIGGLKLFAWYHDRQIKSEDPFVAAVEATVEMENTRDPAQRKMLANTVLAMWEKALADPRPAESRCYMVDQVAMVAVEADDLVKAKSYAQQLLDDPSIVRNGCAIVAQNLHDGNVVLGRIALRQGDLDTAKEFLIKAGKAPAEAGETPATRAFLYGPNMILAKELLEKGERKTVLEYFDLCSKFWADGGVLKRWRSTVESGGIPDFAAHSN